MVDALLDAGPAGLNAPRIPLVTGGVPVPRRLKMDKRWLEARHFKGRS